VHAQGRAERLEPEHLGSARRERAGSEPHRVVGPVEAPADPAVLGVAEALGQVLDQRAAARDVQHLASTADREHGHVALECSLQQRELGPVARPVNAERLLVRLLVVQPGIEIGAGAGRLAGKVWRIGCMGHTARPRNVLALLGALGELLEI